MIKIQFFNEIDPILKDLVRHYWYVFGEVGESYSHSLLLPMDHVDLIMTMGSPFLYGKNERLCQSESIHFHGIREHSLRITQRGNIQAFGISFTPWGFYFFTKQSMSQYVNRVVDLIDVNHSLWKEFSEHMVQSDVPLEFIKLLEKTLIKCISLKSREKDSYRIIEEFIKSDSTNMKEYCEINGISRRRLERIFRKYIGVSPKRFINIVRFEESARDIMYNNKSYLTDISYKHGYYDQPHFTRAFKYYTDFAPKDFQSSKPALKSHFDYE